jgi:hypothetical protein
MNEAMYQGTRRRAGLLAAHIQSFDPESLQARERLEAELGTELTHKLVFALAAHKPERRAA